MIDRPVSQTRPDRRLRHRWVVAAVSIVVAGLALCLAALARYQPLAPGCCEGASDPTYREGAPFSYALEVDNNGFLPVRVVGIDTGGGRSLLRTTGVSVMREMPLAAVGDIRPGLYQPFHPFTLGAGEGRGILVQSVFGGCRLWAKGTGSDVHAVHVRFSVIGMPGDTWMDIGTEFTISSPERCPGRQP